MQLLKNVKAKKTAKTIGFFYYLIKNFYCIKETKFDKKQLFKGIAIDFKGKIMYHKHEIK